MNVHGVSLGPKGGAIVSARWPEAGPPTVVGFERFAADLVPIGQRLQTLHQDDPTSRIVIDGGLHGADLWEFLGKPRRRRQWQLFEIAKPELRRAELAGKLRVAFDTGGFAIVRGLAQEGALTKAITEATREDAADRVEVGALSLAVVNRKPSPPRIG
jgi:hypothetical protein